MSRTRRGVAGQERGGWGSEISTIDAQLNHVIILVPTLDIDGRLRLAAGSSVIKAVHVLVAESRHTVAASKSLAKPSVIADKGAIVTRETISQKLLIIPKGSEYTATHAYCLLPSRS